MPRGRPAPPSKTSLVTLTKQLRSLHELAEDPNEENFPALEDYLGWLKYATTHAKVLSKDAKWRSGDLCIQLCRHLPREIDALQLAAIHVAQSGGAHLTDLAKPLGVSSKGSVTKLIQRLEVEQLRARGELAEDELRTPETHRNRRREQAAALAAFEEVRDAAQGLLAHRTFLLTDESIEEDLDYLHTLIRPEKVMALGASLRAAVSDIRDLAAETGQPAARTTAASAALTRAAKTRS